MATKIDLIERLQTAGVTLTGKESYKDLQKLAKELPASDGEFHVHAELNGQVFDVDTDDVRTTILSFKPEFLKTSLKLKISKGDVIRDRFLYSARAKILFTNPYTLDAFIRALYL